MKTILITGANRGLGRILSEALIAKGHTVIRTSRQPSEGCIQLDVTSESDIRNIKGKFDILVNNASVIEHQLPLQQNLARQVFDINYYGAIRMTQLINANRVIMITSNLAKTNLQVQEISEWLNDKHSGQEIHDQVEKFIKQVDEHNDIGAWNPYKTIYTASKAFLNCYTRNVFPKACCVHPGWLKTEMGGAEAADPIEKGIIAQLKMINEFKPIYEGKYINEIGEIEDY